MRLFILFIFTGFLIHAVAQLPLQPYGAIPAPRQLDWQETEVYGLIHFTPTTFENKEWGYGDADPSLFNPLHFDANQIIDAAKSGGLKGLILVAKHHDGFCLWPTKTTPYNISKSPWRNGKGDMVKEVEQACRKAGLKFGIYCSPWDRNNPNYGKPGYLEIYRAQLKELYTGYGPLFMSWHDGANGGDGYYGGARERRKIDNTTYYDWINTWTKITRVLQPGASIFSDVGLDVRWVGNEKGFSSDTNYASFTPKPETGILAVPGNVDTRSSSQGTRNGKYWMPAECDVPLRPGWFYHPQQDGKEKSASHLVGLYLKSVGRGACLDLGLAPTPDGILHQNDVAILKEFGQRIESTFKKNLIQGATLKASHLRSGSNPVTNLIDGDRYSFWATPDNVHTAYIKIQLKENQDFDLIQLRENIKLGQRIEKATVEIWINGNWKPVSTVLTVGANRLIHLSNPVKTNRLKISFEAPVALAVSEIGLYKMK